MIYFKKEVKKCPRCGNVKINKNDSGQLFCRCGWITKKIPDRENFKNKEIR